MAETIRVEHLARVEGHGGITVELDGDTIGSVRFDIFEGLRLLETMVRGRSYEDVAGVASRVCAICSVAHSLTSLKATETAFGIQVSPQTALLRQLLFRGENIQSHALHLFLLAVPDYLDYPGAAALARDRADLVMLGLHLKKLGNSIQESIGGRAVHPVNVAVGGFGKVPDADQLIALRHGLLDARKDCQTVIDLVASLPSADHCRCDTVFAALRSPGEYGYYAGEEITVISNGTRETIPVSEYRSLTNEKAVLHSHAKHSAFRGEPFMVGALARLAANSDLLDGSAGGFAERLGLALPSRNPMDNNKAQAVELVYDVECALRDVERLLDEGPRPEPPVAVRPRAGAGTAATEAPRGLLFHSYTYDQQGLLASADVITPTAQNAASIENHLRHTVAQSRQIDAPSLTKKLEMVVRAYDPCISCSVHLVRKRHAV